jgi:hypothetical protein
MKTLVWKQVRVVGYVREGEGGLYVTIKHV